MNSSANNSAHSIRTPLARISAERGVDFHQMLIPYAIERLLYLSRYFRDTVDLLLNDYVRELLGKLGEKHLHLTAVTSNESVRPGDRTKAVKELGKIDKTLKEIQTWERDFLLPLAKQRIELDLDDGVKVNCLKFKGAVVNIPGLDKGDEE